MKAYGVTESGAELELVDLEDPKPQGGEVVVDVSRCGVCHSDVHLWDGGMDFGGRLIGLKEMGVEMPAVLGHEIYGTVSAVGPDVQDVAVGESYIVYPWIGCGNCARCKEDRDDLCQQQKALGVQKRGGFGDKVLVREEKFLVNADGIDPAWAATLACSGLTALGAVKKLGDLDPEAGVVVIGAGGVGLAAVGVLKALGHENITVVDISDANLAEAKAAGARQTVNSKTADDAMKAIKAAAGGDVMGVVDFVNGPMTAPLAFGLPSKGGTVVMVGLFGGSMTLPLGLVAVRAIALKGSYVGSLAELRELVDLAKSGKLKRPPIVEKPRAAATETLAGLRDGNVTGRVVLAG